MLHRPLISFGLLLPLVLSGCQTTQGAFDNDCKIAGTAIGAAVGGLAAGLLLGKGNGKFATALIGATAGAFVGNQLGGMLDCHDKQAVATASQSAGDGKVGDKVVWKSETANVPAAPPVRPEVVVETTAQSQPQSQPAATKPQVVAKAAPKPAQKSTAQSTNQWAAVEPVKSAGQSGMWGWVEPTGEPAVTADGRTCRPLKQVAVDTQGVQHEETVTSCINADKQWVVVSR